MVRRFVICATLLWVGLLSVLPLQAAQRFPPPDFESGYKIPATQTPLPRGTFHEYLDVALLVGALGLASYLGLKKRSRRGLVALSVFAVAYFGFYRKGCVCSIGSVQNVALALCDRTYALPLAVGLFFLAPLVFSLFFGRAYCAAVCPHGALQDLALVKPVQVPLWLEQGLSVVPYFYLGTGLLVAATGSAFWFCQYDPFVPLFRRSGSLLMMSVGIGFVLLSTFIGRPFCRFLCPYGALLRMGAMVSKWRVRVTPDTCTQCRLCETACPYGALREPSPAGVESSLTGSASSGVIARTTDRRRLGWLLVALPVLIAGGVWLGPKLSLPLARINPQVALAEQFVAAPHGPGKSQSGPNNATTPSPATPESLALGRAEQQANTLLPAAVRIRQEFAFGGWFLGGWIALVIAAKLIGLSLRTSRTDYEPDRGACFACARCYSACPSERVRLGLGLLPVESTAEGIDCRARVEPRPPEVTVGKEPCGGDTALGRARFHSSPASQV